MPGSAKFWQACLAAVVVVAAVLWLLGVTGWGVFVAVLVLAAVSIATTAIDGRRRREAPR